MVDLKAMTNARAAIATIIAMDDASRTQLFKGLSGLGQAAVLELDTYLAGIGKAAANVPDGAKVAQRVAQVRQQIRSIRTQRGGNLRGMGSWLSEAFHSVTNAVQDVAGAVAPFVNAANGQQQQQALPGYYYAAGQQPYLQQQNTTGNVDWSMLAVLSKLFNTNTSPQVLIPQFNPNAVSANSGSGTIFGLKPEIAALVALGGVFLLTQRR
ncbi:MAG: hypothetical protein JSS51_04020 [Planctomycetes bacterium]|nr:hypothetical protein [Planctomycetota bacterium]